jgi:hypothetical protein
MILWNSKETTPALEDSSVIIDNVFYGSHNVVVDLSELGTLDPARQEKYGVTNWTDLTVAQLEAEIPTFKSVMSVNYDTTGSSDVEIQNKGKNLINLNTDFPAKWGDTDYSDNGNGLWRDGGVEAYEDAPDLGTNAYKIWSLPLWLKGGTTYTLSLYGEKLQPAQLDRLFTYIKLHKLHTNDAAGGSQPSDAVTEIKVNESGEGNLDYQFTPSETGWYSILFDFWSSHAFIKNLQIEEGSEATEYEEPLEEKITISSPQGLHGVDGISDELNKDGTKTKRWTDVVDLSTLTTSDVSLISTNSSKSHIELEIDEDTHGLAKTDAWHNMLFDYLGYYYPDGFRDKAVSWDSTLTAPELTEEEE